MKIIILLNFLVVTHISLSCQRPKPKASSLKEPKSESKEEPSPEEGSDNSTTNETRTDPDNTEDTTPPVSQPTVIDNTTPKIYSFLELCEGTGDTESSNHLISILKKSFDITDCKTFNRKD